MLKERYRLGVIVPSSNTVVEPLTTEIVSSLHYKFTEFTVHYSRCRVTKIDLSDDSGSQFDLEPMLLAAQLLADAKVDVIGWSGTSAGWLGLETDERLCAAITEATGIPTTTSTLALPKLLKRCKEPKVGLVTPYIQDVVDLIQRNFSSMGFPVSYQRERHLGMTKNTAFADVRQAQLDMMVSDIVAQGANVIIILCTNLRAAHRVSHWEKQHGIMVLDSVETVIWDMFGIVGVDCCRLDGWGKIFQLEYKKSPVGHRRTCSAVFVFDMLTQKHLKTLSDW